MDRTKEPSAKELQTECQRLRDSFTDFIDNLPREDLLPQLYMFSSTFDVQEAVQRINRLSAVCFTETFTQDIRKLGKQLKLPLLERNERQFNQSVSVSDREKALAREALQEEYDLLDRVKQNWG